MSNKLPTGYSLPLRSREEIAQYLVYGKGLPAYSTRRPRADLHEQGLFCFDVKVYDIDTSFDHLFELYKENGHGSHEDYWFDPRWQKKARAEHAQIEERLWEWAFEEARDSVNGEDTWKCLWWFGADAHFEAEYDFVGRSCGWLRLMNWSAMNPRGCSRRWDFTEEDQDYWYQIIRGNPHRPGGNPFYRWENDWGEAMTWYDVKKLYAMIRMLEWDFQTDRVQEYVEDAACFRLFATFLEEIPHPREAGWKKSESSCAALVGPRSGW
jgi:hypothetical protein